MEHQAWAKWIPVARANGSKPRLVRIATRRAAIATANFHSTNASYHSNRHLFNNASQARDRERLPVVESALGLIQWWPLRSSRPSTTSPAPDSANANRHVTDAVVTWPALRSHVADAPLVEVVTVRLLVRHAFEVLLFEAVRTVDPVPAVPGLEGVPIWGRWRSAVLR